MENSHIQWTDHTFNPWEGCTKVSPGCANCYAEARNIRFHGGNWGKGKPRRRTSEANWRKPLAWNQNPICDSCGKVFEQLSGRQQLCEPIVGDPCQHCNFGHYRKPRVFCASLADVFDDEARIEWLADLLQLIFSTPNLDWLLLTKRPGNCLGRLFTIWDRDHCKFGARPWIKKWIDGKPPANVWIGTSVEDQKRADERIPELLRIPAAVRFLSVEPMLERIDLWQTYPFLANGPKIHWAIFGGESGAGARPCNIEWIRDGAKQCRAAGVKPFVKQLGANATWSGWSDASKSAAFLTRDKKGGDMAEWPEDLRNVREFPV